MSTAAILRRRPVSSYFVLTFAISWGGAFLAIGGLDMSAASPTADPRFAYAVVAMLAGTSISGLVLTAFVDGTKGVRDLLSRITRWQVESRWYAAALLIAPLVWVATLLTLSRISPTFSAGILTSTDRTSLILVGIAVALGAGIFEEIGWSGFAVPQIRQRHGMFATGLLVGVPWGAWHLLTNVVWPSAVTAGELPLSIFLPASTFGLLFGYLAAYRVLMVWVYDHTRSVLVSMVMHTSLTASVLILDPAGIAGADLITYSFALAVPVWAAVLVITAYEARHVEHRPLRSVNRAA